MPRQAIRRIDGNYIRSICGSSSAVITRPDNADAYAAGDVVGENPAENIEFTNVLPVAGGHFFITDAKIEVEKSAVPANMSSFTLHLFSEAPTAIADNASWTLLLADGGKYLGSIEFNTPEDLGTTLIMWAENINIKRKLADSATSLYGQLVTNGNYTPASEDVINLQLETVGA
jgi:hypothetical protein